MFGNSRRNSSKKNLWTIWFDCPRPPWFVRLRAGSTSGFLGIGGIMHRIEYVQPHPGFNKTTTDFDIGLIKVCNQLHWLHSRSVSKTSGTWLSYFLIGKTSIFIFKPRVAYKSGGWKELHQSRWNRNSIRLGYDECEYVVAWYRPATLCTVEKIAPKLLRTKLFTKQYYSWGGREGAMHVVPKIRGREM